VIRSVLLLPLALAALAPAKGETASRPRAIDGAAQSEDRLSVVDNTDEIEVKQTISELEKAFDSESVEGYANCFRESSRKSVRRKTALLFAAESCSIDIQEMHIIEIVDGEAEVAVRYRLGGGQGTSDVVSTVKLVKEEDRWLVSNENLVSKTAVASRSSRSVPAGQADNWDPYKPDAARVSNNLQHLIGDIGVRPGMGCADGKCANGRCER
jgi:hypothetical protein